MHQHIVGAIMEALDGGPSFICPNNIVLAVFKIHRPRSPD